MEKVTGKNKNTTDMENDKVSLGQCAHLFVGIQNLIKKDVIFYMHSQRRVKKKGNDVAAVTTILSGCMCMVILYGFAQEGPLGMIFVHMCDQKLGTRFPGKDNHF